MHRHTQTHAHMLNLEAHTHTRAISFRAHRLCGTCNIYQTNDACIFRHGFAAFMLSSVPIRDVLVLLQQRDDQQPNTNSALKVYASAVAVVVAPMRPQSRSENTDSTRVVVVVAAWVAPKCMHAHAPAPGQKQSIRLVYKHALARCPFLSRFRGSRRWLHARALPRARRHTHAHTAVFAVHGVNMFAVAWTRHARHATRSTAFAMGTRSRAIG